MSCNRRFEVTKRPDEIFSIGLKYISPDLEEGESISSASVSVSPDNPSGVQAVGNAVIEQDNVAQLISSGVDGSEYYVNFTVTTSGGHIYKDSIFVKVRELE